MSLNNQFERGSEWGKWDLHLHSYYTFLNNNFKSKTEEEYVEAIANSGLKVIGLTNYFKFTDEDYKLKERLESKGLTVFLNLELRLTYQNKEDDLCDFHIIFDNTLSKETIQTFLSNLDVTVGSSQKKANALSQGDDINKLGCVDFNRTIQSLESESLGLKGRYLTGILSRGKGNSRSAILYDTFQKKSDLIIHSSSSDTNIGKDKEYFDSIGKPLTQNSDAHCIDDIGAKFTWIKSKATFEGLKQILYEQKTRIKIQETMPEEKLGYNVIDYIELPSQDFNNQKIYFNQNLNTIIGGRSTGKSTLLKLLHYKTEKFSNKPESYLSNLIDSTTVHWINEHVGDSPEIQYFPQGYMHELSLPEKSNDFDKVVRDIIQQKEFGKKLIQYDNEIQTQSSVIIQKITSLFLKENEIFNKDEEIKKMGSSTAILQEIENIKKRISESVAVTNAKEIQESINKHSSLSEQINSIQKKIDSLDKLSKTLKSMQGRQIISDDILATFNFLDTECDIIDVKESFNSLMLKINRDFSEWINDKLKTINKQLQEAESEKQQIIDCDDYKKGEDLIKQNKIVEDLNLKLKEENIKIGKVQVLEKERKNVIEQKNELVDEIVDLHLSIINNGRQYCSEFNQTDCIDNIKINSELIIKENDLREFYETRFNLRSLENFKVDDFFEFYNSNEKEQFVNFLKGLASGDYVLKNNHNFQNIASELFGQCWYSIKYDVVYQGDNFREMSPGKQAFVVLKLLLDFSNNKCPILIDQPEDSLDNRAIYNELVSYIKKKKTERQIVLVTHNANIVVGADAENVIVANQKGKDSKNFNDVKFQYLSGPLENTKSLDKDCETTLEKQGIREHVCEILEGGQDAFDIREKKYGFK